MSPRSAQLLVLGMLATTSALAQDTPVPPRQDEASEEDSSREEAAKGEAAEHEALRERLNEIFREHVGNAMPEEQLERALEEVLRRGLDDLPAVVEERANMETWRRRVGSMEEPLVRLQLRSGLSDGVCRVNMLQEASENVSAGILPEALPFQQHVSQGEEPAAYVQGGCVPENTLFVIERISYRALPGGDAEVPGRFKIQVGEETIANSKWSPQQAVVRNSWEGELTIRPGDERTVALEITNLGQAEVTFEGRFVAVEVPLKPGDGRFDPSQGVQISANSGQITVRQGDVVLWEGQGSSTSTRSDGVTLVIVVDGEVVCECRAK